MPVVEGVVTFRIPALGYDGLILSILATVCNYFAWQDCALRMISLVFYLTIVSGRGNMGAQLYEMHAIYETTTSVQYGPQSVQSRSVAKLPARQQDPIPPCRPFPKTPSSSSPGPVPSTSEASLLPLPVLSPTCRLCMMPILKLMTWRMMIADAETHQMKTNAT